MDNNCPYCKKEIRIEDLVDRVENFSTCPTIDCPYCKKELTVYLLIDGVEESE